MIADKQTLRACKKGMITTIKRTETKGSCATSPESKCATAQQHSHKGRTMYNIAWCALEHKNK